MKLGLWIDLTNTNRFYDKREIEEQEITYLKLQCRGSVAFNSIVFFILILDILFIEYI